MLAAANDAWLHSRIGKITSSIAAAVLGLDDAKSPIAAWLEVMGMSEFEGNRATHRGTRLEDNVLEYGLDILGAHRYEHPGFVQMPDTPWAGDTCDAIYFDEDDRILAVGEAKTVGLGAAVKWGREGTDEVPPKVLVQSCLHLVHHPAAPECIVPVLFGGYTFEFTHYVVRRDDEWNGMLMQDLEKWHRDYVVAEKRPPVTANDSEFLRRLNPRATEKMMEPTDDMEEIAKEAILAASMAKAAEQRSELARNKIRDSLGNHAGMRGQSFSISYKNDKDSVSTNWQGIAMELGADASIIKRFSVTKDGPRKLRVTATKRK